MTKLYLSLLFIIISGKMFSQGFNMLGTASVDTGCHCYILTNALANQAGAVYSMDSINLNNSFDFTFSNFFGCNSVNGADGEAFVLTTNPNALGRVAEYLGYGGNPGQQFSLAVEFDTYQNGVNGDPIFDHTAFESGGSVQHNVASPVSALANSAHIDDCHWHTVRIVWNAGTSTLSDSFDGVLRISMVIPNIASTYFGGDSMVHWGWTGAGGGAYNLQKVCGFDTCNLLTTEVNRVPEPSVKVYPNPASMVATIETNFQGRDLSFSIFSLDGKLMDSRIIRDSKTTIDVSRFAEGLYAYRIGNLLSGEISYGKLEIQR